MNNEFEFGQLILLSWSIWSIRSIWSNPNQAQVVVVVVVVILVTYQYYVTSGYITSGQILMMVDHSRNNKTEEKALSIIFVQLNFSMFSLFVTISFVCASAALVFNYYIIVVLQL